MRTILMLGALVLSGMSAAAQSSAFLFAPADPQNHGSGPRYQSVTAGLKRYDVVDPKNWIELNRAVGPQKQSEGAVGGGKRDGGAR